MKANVREKINSVFSTRNRASSLNSSNINYDIALAFVSGVEKHVGDLNKNIWTEIHYYSVSKLTSCCEEMFGVDMSIKRISTFDNNAAVKSIVKTFVDHVSSA